ncbi:MULTISPECIES: hypothetical protein [Anaerolinea]|uniref:SLAC1 family transporter n=1 Tax=Anaerolinea TaxID=233189 RepID=UPI002614D9C6|nr:hypothetical protein [Anaerolinea thermophila]
MPTSQPRQEILRTLHPGWFGAVMGTAIVATILSLNPGNLPGFKPVLQAGAIGFHVFALLAMTGLLIPTVIRWFRFPKESVQDIIHPVFGAMFATLPAALLVLASTTASVGKLWLSPSLTNLLLMILSVTGTLLGFAISILFTYALFLNTEVRKEHANGAWFIPPVVNIIIPLALLALIPLVPEAWRSSVFALSVAFWGAGFFLFLMVAAVLYERLIFHALPPAGMIPSLWIGLGPIGVGGLVLLRLVQTGAAFLNESTPILMQGATMAALSLWGLGIWWLGVLILVTTRVEKNGGIPYSPGWWGYVFPGGAFTALTLSLARTLNSSFFEIVGALFTLGLLFLWIRVFWNTLKAVQNGMAWKRG